MEYGKLGSLCEKCLCDKFKIETNKDGTIVVICINCGNIIYKKPITES